MIANTHPILTLLSELPFTFHLVGSRYVGVFTEASDYDFLGVAKDYAEWTALKERLSEHGFRVQHPHEYGPDHRLYDSDVWTWRGDGKHPPVDVLPVSPDEAAFRLRWFESMKAVGHKSGFIAKGLKAEQAWTLLWDVLSEFDDHQAR